MPAYQVTATLTDECIAALKDRKQKDGLTWVELSENLQIDDNTLYRLMNRSRGVGVEITVRLSEYLGIPTERIHTRPTKKISACSSY